MLKKNPNYARIKGPIVTVVMDGIGLSSNTVGNAFANANTPVLDRLFRDYGHIALKAHGKAVGMPSDDDMGNSEVGHNALGSGQVYNQGASLVKEAIDSGELFEKDAWKELTGNAKAHNSTLHFLGLFSDGNVHSHIDHLKAMIARAKKENQARVRIHILLDGRDVPETSALDYVEPFEAFLDELNDGSFDAAIASGGGRMNITMDRYEANWSMVEKGWHTHVLGEGPQFASAAEAIKALRVQHPGTIDQDLPPFVIAKDGEPVGRIEDNDSVVFFNFRGDRAIEITRAFEEDDFSVFDRVRYPKVVYAGMLEYDGDLHIPEALPGAAAVHPQHPRRVSGRRKASPSWRSRRPRNTATSPISGTATAAASSVTNWRTTSRFRPDVVPYEERPWMKAAEITDELIRQLKTGKHRFARVNYANGDMVGHTGIYRCGADRRCDGRSGPAPAAAGHRRAGRGRADHRRSRQRRRDVRGGQEVR